MRGSVTIYIYIYIYAYIRAYMMWMMKVKKRVPAQHPATVDENGDLLQRLGHLLLPLLGVEELQQAHERRRVS
jgi:hypothetical protein